MKFIQECYDWLFTSASDSTSDISIFTCRSESSSDRNRILESEENGAVLILLMLIQLTKLLTWEKNFKSTPPFVNLACNIQKWASFTKVWTGLGLAIFDGRMQESS